MIPSTSTAYLAMDDDYRVVTALSYDELVRRVREHQGAWMEVPVIYGNGSDDRPATSFYVQPISVRHESISRVGCADHRDAEEAMSVAQAVRKARDEHPRWFDSRPWA